MNLLKVLIFTILVAPSFGAEVDSFTYISSKKSSGFRYINKTVNSWLDVAVENLNLEEVDCVQSLEESEDFYDIVKESISYPFIGHSVAVFFDENLPENTITRTPFHLSIYNQMSWMEGFSLNLKGLLGLTVARGNKIGMDKLGHFFVEGWGFYKRAYLKDEISIDRAIRWGKFTEETYFGKSTTGVYSNADLVANFNGMRFWNHLLLLNKDVIRSFNYFRKPLLSCKEGVWKKEQKFSFHYFLDGAWDESKNCNNYDTSDIQNHVNFQTAMKVGSFELNKVNGRVCPMVDFDCSKEKRKYGKYAKDLLHKSCFNEKQSYFVDFSPINILENASHYLFNSLHQPQVNIEELLKKYSKEQAQ